MQKKLIALAVAGLASTAAFAQTNVQIYGSLDYGYSYRFDARNPAVGGSTSGFNSASQFNGGQSAGNRIGFKGTEDLGNGLKAVFLIEQGFNLEANENGSTTSSNSFSFTRQAYVGLSGNFGTAVGGRLYTPHYTFVSSIDPFAAGTVGRYNNVFGNTDVSATIDPVRVNNAIAYVSPSFGGFTITGAFSNNALANDSTVSNAQNATVYALLGQYANGPINAGLGYHYIAGNSPATNGGIAVGGLAAIDNVQNIVLGGTYDFKVVKLSLLGDWNAVDYTAANTSTARVSNYLIGATVPVGKFDIQGTYIFSDGNTAAGGDAQQIALGGKYNLSKRTNFYTAYSYIDNSNKRNSAVGDAVNTGYAGTSGFAWQQGFQVGVRHQF